MAKQNKRAFQPLDDEEKELMASIHLKIKNGLCIIAQPSLNHLANPIP